MAGTLHLCSFNKPRKIHLFLWQRGPQTNYCREQTFFFLPRIGLEIFVAQIYVIVHYDTSKYNI